MDASGGVPEPLLPPQMALQNPELVGGELFHVLPALGQILVMIDADGDENYVPHVIPLDGGFPEPLADEPFAGGRSHLVHVDDETEIAYFAVESREEASITAVRVHLRTRATEELWQSSYGAMVAAWTPDHSRVVFVDGYTMGDTVLYEIDDAGTRRMLYGAPIEERDPEAQQPLAGFRGGYGTASGAGVLLTTHAARRHGLARVSRPLATGRGRSRCDRRSRARGRRRARRARPPRGRSLRADVQHRRLLVGVRRDVRRGDALVLGGACARRARASSRAVSCTAFTTTPAAVATSRRSARPRPRRSFTCSRPTTRRLTTLTRERALGLAPDAPLARRGRFVRVARRPASLGSPLPAVVRARIRGRAAARLLRPRRAAEPGTAELRVVLDAARSDPHARGVRRVRPECARIDRLRARLLEARRPRLGWARPPRPRPRDDRGASARRAGGHVAGRCRGALVRRLHDPDARRTTPRAVARSRRHVRPVRPLHVHGSPAGDLEAVLRALGRRSGGRPRLHRRPLAEDPHREHLVPAARHPGAERSAGRRARVARRRRAAPRARARRRLPRVRGRGARRLEARQTESAATTRSSRSSRSICPSPC